MPQSTTFDSNSAVGQRTTFTIDAYGNITQVQQPGGIITSYTWNTPISGQLMMSLASFTDARGHTTTYNYAKMNDRSYRLASIVQPTGIFTYTYDTANNRLQSVADQNGNVSTLTYEGSTFNRIGFQDANGHTTTCAYNPYGQIIALQDPLVLQREINLYHSVAERRE